MSPETRRRVKKALIDCLKGKCARCPETTDLQFDCIKPTGPAHHKMFSDARLKFYQFQLDRGNLQLLCGKCHTAKTTQEWNEKHGRMILLASAISGTRALPKL